MIYNKNNFQTAPILILSLKLYKNIQIRKFLFLVINIGSFDHNLEVKAALRILKPADIVYEAIVDPVKMSNYFISEGSERMEDGKEIQCGWLKDKFGVSWQIVPSILSAIKSDD